MSRRFPVSALRNYNKVITLRSITSSSQLMSSSVPILRENQRLCSSLSSENLQIPKLELALTPLDKILWSSGQNSLSGKESVALLKALRMEVLFKGVDSKMFKTNPKFENLCYAFQRDCFRMHPNLLISGLRSLLEIGVPPESSVVVSAEKAVINNISKFSTFNIIGCLYYHHKFMKTDLQTEVVSQLKAELGKHLSGIQSASEVFMLLHVNYLFDNELKKKVELKMTELIPNFDVHEMLKMVCIMSETSNRNVSLLNVLSFYLTQKSEDLEFKDTIDLFYAFKNLNFFGPNLFKHFINNLVPKIPSVTKPALISGLLTICGHGKWKEPGLLNACETWIKTNFDLCSMREFRAYILAIGALNHESSQTKPLLALMTPHLTLPNIKSASVYLDIAWSLSVLGCIPKEMLLEILSPPFYEPLLKESDSPAADSIKLKLLNLKGILKISHPECVFGCNLFLEPPKMKESVEITSSRNHVIKVLSNIVPRNKCMSLNQVNDAGIFIDAEFIMTKSNKFIPLKEYGMKSKAVSITKPLPSDYIRVAFLIMFPKDYTVSTLSLTGPNVLGEKILTKEGYKVVHMQYSKFSQNKTEVEKAKYLLGKIKKSATNT